MKIIFRTMTVRQDSRDLQIISFAWKLIQICSKPSFVQLMACHRTHATSHYLNRWWPCLLAHICDTRSQWVNMWFSGLTHWGRVTHICVDKLIMIGSDNDLSPDRRQAIIWTNARFLSIGPLRTYFNENLIKIQQFSLKKMHVKMSSAKWRPSCLGLNVLMVCGVFSGSWAVC